MSTNENIARNRTRNLQSIGFIRLINLSMLSLVIGFLLGELIFWILLPFSTFILQRFNDGLSDFGAMFLGMFLGFYLKPIVSGISTLVAFSILLKTSKTITNKNLSSIFETSLIYAITTMLAMGMSIILSAIEANIPFANLSEIYLLFIR